MREDILQKLKILGEAARYDASCASSGSGRQGKDGFGSASMSGICHSWAEDGRCISLLKILMSNACVYNCAYCINRCDSDVRRATFTPEEIAELTCEFYKRNYIEGLFLSSGVVGSPARTMELMIRAVELLRVEHRFFGYIHVKVIPGADPELIERIGMLADRVSVNIELPTEESLRRLAPRKEKKAILAPMSSIRRLREQNLEEKRKYRHSPTFAPAGQSTQMIVGATGESDRTILRLSSALYGTFSMKRVYFSAYVPVAKSPLLPPPDTETPLLREHRLYQADWLMRFYSFSAEEIAEEGENLPLDLDPKCAWALRHRGIFPVEVNTAPRELLLRVPGIGVRSAARIIAARKLHALTLEDLVTMGVVFKRAQYFLTAKGRYGGRTSTDDPFLPLRLSEDPTRGLQLSLFDPPVLPLLVR